MLKGRSMKLTRNDWNIQENGFILPLKTSNLIWVEKEEDLTSPFLEIPFL